jgi:dephospho-CoA kinase
VIILGITGGIGMGKSTSGQLLMQQGVAVVDTDIIARQAVEPGQPALSEIREKFGPAVLLPDGSLDRKELARLAFANPSARSDLEAILHPRIRAAWTAEADNWRKAGCTCGAVVIPLLFETGAERLLDATVCVACSATAQARRLHARGWDAAQIQQRVEAQWPVEKKIARSDFVVWSGATLQVHAEQLLKIIRRCIPGSTRPDSRSGC